MKKYIYGILLAQNLLASLASATPLCRSILLRPVTSAQLNDTIQDIAALKLQMDLEQTEQSSSAVYRTIRVLFYEKLNELYARTANEKDKSDIDDLIRLRIADLQKKNEEITSKETQERQSHEKPLLTQKDPKILPKPFRQLHYFGEYGSYPKMSYLGKLDALVFLKSSSLMRDDLNGEKTTTVARNVRGYSIQNGEQSLYYVTKTKKLVHYDPLSKKIINTLSLDLNDSLANDFVNLRFSPSLKTVTIFNSKLFEVFDMQTGEMMVSSKSARVAQKGGIKNIDYTSETKILFNSLEDFFALEIPTGVASKKMNVEFLEDWIYTADKKNIIAKSQGIMSWIPSKNSTAAGFHTALWGDRLLLGTSAEAQPIYVVATPDAVSMFNPKLVEEVFKVEAPNKILNAAVAENGMLAVLVWESDLQQAKLNYIDLGHYVDQLLFKR